MVSSHALTIFLLYDFRLSWLFTWVIAMSFHKVSASSDLITILGGSW